MLTLLPSFLIFKPGDFHDLRCVGVERVLKLGLEIDVFGLVARRIGVGDVGRDQFLTRAQQIHVALQIAADTCEHAASHAVSVHRAHSNSQRRFP